MSQMEAVLWVSSEQNDSAAIPPGGRNMKYELLQWHR